MIPKKIHYVWLGHGKKSPKMKRCLASWQQVLVPAGYEIIEWNEDNWDVTQNKFAHENYQAGKYAYPSDVMRLDVLYRYGGIYIDTDILVKKPFDEFLNLPAFWAMQFDNTISTSIFGAEAGNPFIRSLLTKYDGFDRQMILDGRLPETNNEIITKALLDYYPEFVLEDKKQILNDGTVIFPKEYFMFPTFNKSMGYSEHLFTKTWGHDGYSKAHYVIKDMVHRLVGDVVFGKISSARGRKLFLQNEEYQRERDNKKQGS